MDCRRRLVGASAPHKHSAKSALEESAARSLADACRSFRIRPTNKPSSTHVGEDSAASKDLSTGEKSEGYMYSRNTHVSTHH